MKGRRGGKEERRKGGKEKRKKRGGREEEGRKRREGGEEGGRGGGRGGEERGENEMKGGGEEEISHLSIVGTTNPAILLTHRFYLLHKRMVAGLGNTVLQFVELASYPLHQH